MSYEYHRALIEGEFVTRVGFGKGFNVVRQWGLDTLQNVVQLFASEVGLQRPIVSNSVGMRISKDRYLKQVSSFGGFDNIYEFHGEEAYVLRPDAAVDNLTMLRAMGTCDQVMASFEGFRSVKGATSPLFRDRYIMPFVQFNRIVPRDQSAGETDKIIAALGRFFDSLALPHRIVDFGPWKSYAKRLFAVVVSLPDGSPTIAGMFYLVGDAYLSAAGLSENCDAFDVGITEKVLALIAARHLDESGMRLPSCVAPVQLLVHPSLHRRELSSIPRIPPSRILVDPVSGRSSRRHWARKGVPLQLYRGLRGLRLFRRSFGWCDLADIRTLPEHLENEDEELWRRSSQVDLKKASPPYWTSAGETTGHVVHVSKRLAADLAGRLPTHNWVGPRTFY